MCLALSSALERWGDIQATSFLRVITWPQLSKAGLHSGPLHARSPGAQLQQKVGVHHLVECDFCPMSCGRNPPGTQKTKAPYSLSDVLGALLGKKKTFQSTKEHKLQKEDFNLFYLKCFPLEKLDPCLFSTQHPLMTL